VYAYVLEGKYMNVNEDVDEDADVDVYIEVYANVYFMCN
jgi:hypothetical protein